MADVHDKNTRSFNMSKIGGKNTKPEMLVRKFLYANSYRYRLHVNNLPGKPDIVLPKYKTVITVHGCFWHGHLGCKYYVVPKTRTEWWKNKIERTKERDIACKEALEKMGWKVIVIFECGLKPKTIDETLNNLIKEIEN